MPQPQTILLPLSQYHLDDVAKIEAASFSTPWSYQQLADELNNPLARYVVLLADGKCVGYGGGFAVADEFEITTIAVAAEHRRNGYGARLLQGLTDKAKETGAETMYLEVRVSNEAAQALYRRFGFSEIGRRANYYTQPTEDAILMARLLTD